MGIDYDPINPSLPSNAKGWIAQCLLISKEDDPCQILGILPKERPRTLITNALKWLRSSDERPLPQSAPIIASNHVHRLAKYRQALFHLAHEFGRTG